MTKTEICAILSSSGWKEDRYGNFLSSLGGIRVHFQKISVRVEKKVSYTEFCGYTRPAEWVAITSAYLKDVATKDGRLVVGGKLLKVQA